MMIHDVTEKVGRHKKRKRIGRGIGSGRGKTSTRGAKGAKSRSGAGGSIRASREGGQMPLFRRLPKVGFSNFKFRTEYEVINLKALESRFEAGGEVNAEALVAKGLLSNVKRPVKVLGEGELTKKLTVTASAFSKMAVEKIQKAGGTANVVAAAAKDIAEAKA